ncbi:CDP-alcohol phosphatidyltransferase family protein [Actinomadura madurae]|uniref:CDP-alcohol phosphatidyltransferase family protein n=1 Tax=Actinomadura madurae TaxID=1993 RepID=UPI0020260080|nr:CDP-alcohol phosphatidyltransferase family protein [Actinomadura madurae]MCP9954545.1 CDP-alcohol phosphatidyltransferase family protein [Actinomadura madurae]MCP9971284.1 CDP-alcohol phosphatidyltransferase family protein [Actinomadura madurae]MCP9983772.1 CDP-alcohol phosphatidyltransferase family protein [Actinomadura madurae]MCQ0004666.1 CDP-alcohol phosphatidyltransferase family protein [Actinomadura madurae]MCQ0020012.1 CDP-alcohol phosphatidyltransferase family protein [Actinomadura 
MIAGTPDPVAGSPEPPQAGVWNIANALTLARIALVPVFVWLFFLDGTGWRLAAFAVFAVASITDKIDGDIARARGLVTDFGKIADPIADKALTGAALVSLSVMGELWWWVTAAIMVREIGITVMRFAVIRRGVIPASKGGKLKTMLQVVAIGLYILPGPLDYLRWVTMGAALVVTVATGIDYVAQAWRLRRTGSETS